jgi:DNA-binding IclR family transcriptional regulator
MQGPKKKDSKNRSLERALQILDAFTRDRRVLRCAQLSKMVDLSRATVQRLCSTLVAYGYLKQEGESHCYSLGMRIFEQGSIVFHSLSVRRAASAHMDGLLRQTGQTVFLAVLDDGELVYIDIREDAGSLIRIALKIGSRYAPHWGICGPLLMAYLPDSEIEVLLRKHPLRRYTSKSIVDNNDFIGWLGRIRKEGLAIDAGTSIAGIAGIAAPVRDVDGNVVAGLGIAMTSVHDDRSLRRTAKAVSESAWAISRELGFKDPAPVRDSSRISSRYKTGRSKPVLRSSNRELSHLKTPK